VLVDLRDGLAFIAGEDALRDPLLMTSAALLAVGPVVGLLAAIVHARGGAIGDLGLLTAGFGVGSLTGAVYAGARPEGDRPSRRYALLGLLMALGAAAAVLLPLGLPSAAPLGAIGFAAAAEVVWNTSRVQRAAPRDYQARAQAITSMAGTLGFALGMLWAGSAVDRFGAGALLWGAGGLGVLCLGVLARGRRS
jgi:predicted MFS family arabinose efflux permease